MQKQCPKSYSRLENVILKNYNAGYRKALETNNENWMRVKIKEVIEGIKSCRRELRRYYVNFSHEVVGPLHRAYNLDNPGSVYNKDEFRYLNVHFVNYLQETRVVRGSRFSDLRDMLVNYKDWQDICVTGEGAISKNQTITLSRIYVLREKELRGRDLSSFLVKLCKTVSKEKERELSFLFFFECFDLTLSLFFC